MKNIYACICRIGTIAAGLFLTVALPVAVNAQTYCTPAYSTGCTSGDDIDDVILNGANGTMISNLGNPCPAGGYQNYTTSTAPNMTADLILGNTYTGNVTTNYAFGNESVKIWIDFNNNGTFETTEVVATLNNISSTSTGAISIAIPAITSVGTRRMRIRLNYTSTAAGIDPCNSVTWGECHDYNVNILPLAPPDNAGVDSLVAPDMNGVFCSGQQEVKVRVRNLGVNPINSLTVNWSVNGVLQTPVMYNNLIDSIYSPSTNMATVTLGNVVFPYATGVNIKSWTSMPNGVPDNDHSDDTLSLTVTSNKQGIDLGITPGDTIICMGTAIALDAGAFTQNPIYIWSTGALTQTITVSEAGLYSVKVMNSDGCQDRDTVYVNVYPNPVANSIAIIDNGGGSFTFNIIGAQNVTNYTWDFGDGTIESGPGPKTHTYDDDGEYTAKVTLTNDCGEVVITRLIAVSNGATDINDIAGLQRELKVFPNPGRDMVTIGHNGGIKMQRVAIYNLMGQQVYSSEVKNGDRHQVSVSGMASGIYNVVIFTDKGKATKKLEVIK
jgi:hypothetical protein